MSSQTTQKEILDGLSGSCWFTTRDLAQGFLQVEMDEKYKHETEFSTHRGIARWSRLVFVKVQQHSKVWGEVSRPGTTCDRSKVEAVVNWPVPSNVPSFLGTVIYSRKYISKIVEISKPLTNLTKKTLKLDWCEKCQTSFEKLKAALLSAPILERESLFSTPRGLAQFCGRYRTGTRKSSHTRASLCLLPWNTIVLHM